MQRHIFKPECHVLPFCSFHSLPMRVITALSLQGFQPELLHFFFSSFSFKPYIEVKVPQSCLTSLRPHGLYSPWNSPGQNTEVDSFSLFQGIFTAQRLNPGLPHCRQILHQLSHKGSPTGVGSLSLLQQVFPTQESNPGLLRCRWVLHQLSYQGSPIIKSFVYDNT